MASDGTTAVIDKIGGKYYTNTVDSFLTPKNGTLGDIITLKDADAQIGAVMWRTRSLPFRPEDGMRVIVRGRLSVYPPQGKYQIDVSAMRPEGVGDLHRAFEQLREALRARGLFDADRKVQLPRRPRSVGIATSQTGAALQDMLSTINRRYPLLDVVFRPTMVQGDGAAEDIARAIAELDAAKLDVIIIGRGGGSLEDLWSFNTEVVAMAIANARTPIISAVGHETDVTISDFVADVRAETPTAAAVLVTPITVDDLIDALDDRMLSMTTMVRTRIDDMLETAESFVDGRAARRVTERIRLRQQRIDDLVTRTSRGIRHHTHLLQQRIEHTTQYLTSLHPLAPLRRGYAVIERNGVVLGPNDRVHLGDTLVVQRYADSSTVSVEAIGQPTILPQHNDHDGTEG